MWHTVCGKRSRLWLIQFSIQNVENGFVGDVQTKMKKVILCFTSHFVCAWFRKVIEGVVKLVEKLYDEVEMVNGFCYLGSRLNASR